MSIELLHQKLIKAAKATPADDRVPYAFEKRVMANLVARPAPRFDFFKLLIPTGALACLLIIGYYLYPAEQVSVKDFENAVLTIPE